MSSSSTSRFRPTCRASTTYRRMASSYRYPTYRKGTKYSRGMATSYTRRRYASTYISPPRRTYRGRVTLLPIRAPYATWSSRGYPMAPVQRRLARSSSWQTSLLQASKSAHPSSLKGCRSSLKSSLMRLLTSTQGASPGIMTQGMFNSFVSCGAYAYLNGNPPASYFYAEPSKHTRHHHLHADHIIDYTGSSNGTSGIGQLYLLVVSDQASTSTDDIPPTMNYNSCLYYTDA